MEIVKKRKVRIFLILLLVLLTSFCFFYNKSNSIDYELVHKVKIDGYNADKNNMSWFILVNEEYNPFFGIETIDNEFGVDSSLIDYDFDLDNYSYIICCRHTLQKLTFKLSNVLQRNKFLLPCEFGADAVLNEDEENYIFIYRMKKMNVVYDYHN